MTPEFIHEVLAEVRRSLAAKSSSKQDSGQQDRPAPAEGQRYDA